MWCRVVGGEQRKLPHPISGGQKQRVVIAMTLANHPELLIADERLVRCHLYQEHIKPPELPIVKEQWRGRSESQEKIISVQNLSIYFTSRSGFLTRPRHAGSGDAFIKD